MGDRTYVTLQILTVCKAEALQVIEGQEEDYPDREFTCFSFTEVNYGELPFLDNLANLGIAYDSIWCAGNQYGAGVQFCRFTPEGEKQIIEVYDSEINPNLDTLLELIDKPVELRECILNHQARVTPLPWDNQLEYSKIFRLRQLITS